MKRHPRWTLGAIALAAGTSTAATNASPDIKPCALLTAAQVSTVLPNHDAGTVAADGESLIAGVKAYQCSYVSPDVYLLTVIVNVAIDDARLAKILPSASMHADDRKIAVGDGGWVWGDERGLNVEAIKGRAVLELHLTAPGAGQKAEALVALARAVAQKL